MTIVVITCAIFTCFFFSLQNAIVLSLFLPYLIVCKHTAAAAESQTRRHFMQTRGFPPIHNHLSLLFPWKTGGFRDLSPPIRGLQVYVEGNYSIWSQFPLHLSLSDQESPEKWPKKSVLSVHSTSKNEEKKMANIQTFDGKIYFKPKTTGRKRKKKKLAFAYIVNARWGYKFDTRCEC